MWSLPISSDPPSFERPRKWAAELAEVGHWKSIWCRTARMVTVSPLNR